MSRDIPHTTVSIKPADALFLSWATGINASGLFREALTEQMTYRGIDRNRLSELVEEALADGDHELEDLLDQTSSIEELENLIETTSDDDGTSPQQ
jgi:hypothetical protein